MRMRVVRTRSGAGPMEAAIMTSCVLPLSSLLPPSQWPSAHGHGPGRPPPPPPSLLSHGHCESMNLAAPGSSSSSPSSAVATRASKVYRGRGRENQGRKGGWLSSSLPSALIFPRGISAGGPLRFPSRQGWWAVVYVWSYLKLFLNETHQFQTGIFWFITIG